MPGSADDAFFVEDQFARVWRTADGLGSAAAVGSKTLNLSRAKVGKTKKLAVTVRFSGNTVLRPASQNMTVRVPR